MATNTDIPQGYKATALGIIPQEWEMKTLGQIANVFSGTTPSRENELFFNDGTIPWVKTTDLNNGILTHTEERITDIALKSTTLKVFSKGTVLIAMYGGFNQIGRTSILGIDATINQALSALILNTKEITEYFLLYWLLYRVNKWKRYAASSRKDPNITKTDVTRFPILVPPLAEQRKIAEVLGMWDEAIEKQVRLIEKLDLRKRALMQRLLSAKLRLPGFSDPWKELKINKITIIRKGEQVNKDVLFSNAKYPVINGGITPSGYLDIYNTKANTITISEGGNSCGYVNFMTTPFWSGGHCYTIEAKDGINNLCIYQLLKNNEKYIMSLRVGSGLPNIQIKDLGNLKFMIPTYQEQTAIAEVLTASDREIELAKEKLERLRRQKRGLMQQLLTGKKRVKYGN